MIPPFSQLSSSYVVCLDGVGLGVVVVAVGDAQLTDGAELGDGLGVLGLHLKLIEEGANLRKATTANHTKVEVLGVLGEVADAAGAVDATVEDDAGLGVEVEVFDGVLVLLVTGHIGTIVHRNVLKVAVGRLLANGAVVGVVDEDQLDVTLAGIADEARLGDDGHAGQHGGRARDNERLGALDLHEAHTAVTGDGEDGVVAELGDADALALEHLEEVLLLRDDLNGALVDEHEGAGLVLRVVTHRNLLDVRLGDLAGVVIGGEAVVEATVVDAVLAAEGAEGGVEGGRGRGERLSGGERPRREEPLHVCCCLIFN